MYAQVKQVPHSNLRLLNRQDISYYFLHKSQAYLTKGLYENEIWEVFIADCCEDLTVFKQELYHSLKRAFLSLLHLEQHTHTVLHYKLYVEKTNLSAEHPQKNTINHSQLTH